jgi:SNF2 family DNA or RNA helicase
MVDHNILDYVPSQRRRFTASADSDDDGDDDVWMPASERRKALSKQARDAARTVSARKTYDEFFSDSELEEDEEKRKERPLFEEIEEDIIEKVCDSRKRAILPDGTLGDVIEDESGLQEGSYVEEYLIHWRGWAHIHNTWSTPEALVALKGYKKLENFIKKKKELEYRKKTANPEEIEQMNVYEEMERQMLAKWVHVDRVIAHKEITNPDTSNTNSKYEYLVKWKYLPYSECTWEFAETIKDFQKEIDSYWRIHDDGGYAYPTMTSETFRFNQITEQPSWFKNGELREYQLEGVNWLYYSWCRQTNVILADEMGLGKTLQTITFLNFLYHEKGIMGPFLIVAPLSVLPSWMKEFKKWAPELYVVPYIGDSRSREIIRTFDMFYDKEGGKNFKFNVLLTTYEQILKDAEFLGKLSWSYLAVDEAHRLKNDKAKLYESLIQFKTQARLLITGTPLQNTLKELWCLLHFLMPEKFNSIEAFEKHYSELHSQDRLSQLHEELAPHILRRLKVDVEKSLPNKIERILRVGLSDLQKKYYKWVLSKNYQELSKCGSQASLLNIVVELKKCCNHPFLFEGSRDRILASNKHKNEIDLIISASGKMILLDKLLVRLKETGHRVLIFSQMVKMLDVLGRYLALRGFKFQRLDGSTSSRERQHVVDHFNAANSEDFCFLLSTRAGGLGINLATADTVIIFDSDWNPQNDLQAEARAHRIGQTKVVNIYRLVTSNTVEEKILESAKQKIILDHLVIQRMDTSGRTVIDQDKSKKSYSQFSKQELAEVLKFGAANLFKKENAENQEGSGEGEGGTKELTEMDIDEILARAETTNKSELEAEQAAAQSKSLMSAFKVANFSIIDPVSAKAPKTGTNMTKEDQERERKFWEQLISEEEYRSVQEPLYLPTRNARKRKQVSHYNPSGDDNYDPDQVDDENSSDEEYISKKKKKSDKNRIGGFNIPETRAFVKAFKKFADPSRMQSILEDADLVGKKHEHDVKALLQSLINACQDAVNPPDLNKKLSSSRKKKKDSNYKIPETIDFNGIKVNPLEIVERMEQIEMLKKKIDTYDDPSEFRKQVNTKTIKGWPVKWGLTDDANLLRGILKHGIGSWIKIRNDEQLNLTDKIQESNEEESDKEKRRVKPMQLSRRVDILLAAISEEVKKEEERKAKEKTKSGSASSKATSSSKSRSEVLDTSATTSKPRRTTRNRTNDYNEAESVLNTADEQEEEIKIRKTRSSKSASVTTTASSRRHSTRSGSIKIKVEDSDILDICEQHFEPVMGSIDEISQLTEEDDKHRRLQVLKTGLVNIGQHISETIRNKDQYDTVIANATDEQLARTMWEYVHNRTHTSGDSTTLQNLYHKLISKSNKKEETSTYDTFKRSKLSRSSAKKKSTENNICLRESSDVDSVAHASIDANRNTRRSTRQAVNYQESDYEDNDFAKKDSKLKTNNNNKRKLTSEYGEVIPKKKKSRK